jgi:hypothetical protein
MREDLRSTFDQLLGRQATEREVQNLYRVKAALGIRDNDALWLVLMALESYASLYSTYPGRISDEVGKIVEEQKAVLRQTAELESARARGALAEVVSKTSIALASTVAEASWYQSWGWLLVGLMGFGGICMLAGALLASGRLPTWSPALVDRGPAAVILSTVARTPAGWLAAFGGGCAGIASAWRVRTDIRQGKRFGLLASSIALVLTSIAFLLPALWVN